MQKIKSSRRECEIKFKLNSKKEIGRVLSILNKEGFVNKGTQLETDYVPDSVDFLCRKNNIIFRLRLIKKNKSSDILLTLKIDNSSDKGFKNAIEYEYFFSKINYLIFKKVKKLLLNKINISLAPEIHKYKDLDGIIQYTKKIGLVKIRTLVQKKRTSFKRGEEVVTLDEFPDKVGNFMEIETTTPRSLNKLINLFKIPIDKIDVRNYGTIVKEYNVNLPEEKRGIMVFKLSKIIDHTI